MGIPIYDGIQNRLVNSTDAMAADKLLKLKEDSGSNPWPVIEQCIKIWADKHPTKWDAYLVKVQNVRDTRHNSKYANSPDPNSGGRYLLDIPQSVMLMIRCVYDADELPMNKEFFHEWMVRFPKMAIPEKI